MDEVDIVDEAFIDADQTRVYTALGDVIPDLAQDRGFRRSSR